MTPHVSPARQLLSSTAYQSRIITMAEQWRDIAARKQAERQSRIPKAWLLPSSINLDQDNVQHIPRECGILTPAEIRITEQHDATALVSALANGTLTSEAVTTAFCKRAAIAQQLTNCLTEIMFDDAIRRAKWLDEEFKRTGKPKGPLHGLPISLKDTFKIKGYDASIAIASLCFKPSTTNSALVDLLLDLGAVLYCKTNIPQTMMALDSHNNIFGRVRNPSHAGLTPGGSSGGEGALVGMRGSPIGIGTDVGGSIRIPALCNGLYGVKPSHGRVPYAGQEGGLAPGSSKLGIEATAGPIAQSMRDCEMLLAAIGESRPWIFDPDVIPQSWEQQPSIHTILPAPGNRLKPALRIGIVHADGICTPLPPIQRVISEVASSLRSHPTHNLTPLQVVELDLSPLLSQCLKVSNGIFSLDGNNQWFDLLEPTGEPLSPWLQSRLKRRPAKSVDDIRKLHGQKLELQTQTLKIWKALDVLICPAAPHPIPPIDRWNSVNYTSAFNLLDLPAGVLPVRKVSGEDLQAGMDGSKELNGWDKINRELWGQQERKMYEGTVLSVQIVAPRLEERRLVESMAIIDEVLRRRGDGGGRQQSKL